MAEFGENLKRIREEKGMTQQTLADQLFVTRQAVSRWEGGSRYPDLMTAKKMAQFLEVTLDELLSDDDMKLYVEKNAILDNGVSKRAQIVLVSLAFMCSLVLSIIYVANYLIQDMYVMESKSEMAKCILLTLVLGYGTYAALYDKLNPRIAVWVSALYFGTAILTGVVVIIWMETELNRVVFIGITLLNIAFLVSCIMFFGGKRKVSPIPLYTLAGIYGVIGVINTFSGFAMDYPIEIARDAVMLHLFAFLENMLILAWLVMMAYSLNRKRKLL